MSQQLEIPEPLFTRLIDAAQQEGTTPVGWIEHHLPPEPAEPPPHVKSMGDLLGDSIGKFQSGGDLRASERVNELFGEYLEQKQREGRL